MGLFINHNRHPDVYKNHLDIKEPNQGVYKQDYLSEIIEEQQRENDLLRDSFHEMENSYKKQSRIQSRRMANIRYNLEKLEDKQTKQKEVESNVIESLGRYEDKNGELTLKMDHQIELQHKLASQLAEQGDVQHEVIKRLENQEAISEKLLRQIDNFRSILYERTNYLAEKIEKGNTSTSSYVYKMITANKEPVIHEEIKEKQKTLE